MDSSFASIIAIPKLLLTKPSARLLLPRLSRQSTLFAVSTAMLLVLQLVVLKLTLILVLLLPEFLRHMRSIHSPSLLSLLLSLELLDNSPRLTLSLCLLVVSHSSGI